MKRTGKNSLDDQDEVIAMVDQINLVLAGHERPLVHTALSMAMAVAIISVTENEQEREETLAQAIDTSRCFFTKEWIEYVRERTRLIHDAPGRA
jgi:hypothetical protein